MTLTDEEAKAIVLELRSDAACTWCDGFGKEANLDGDGHTDETCQHCEGSGVEFPTTRAIIAMLESRIGVEDELTAAYMAGFERGREVGRGE